MYLYENYIDRFISMTNNSTDRDISLDKNYIDRYNSLTNN